MADVRSLLRQQRAARRIEHPHAAYSEAGKLLCTLCHDHIKTESLWDGHIQSDSHKARLLQLRAAAQANGASDAQKTAQKRKHDDDDEDSANGSGDVDMEDSMRRKRSKQDMALHGHEVDGDKDQTLTPPRLTRRTSTTPSQGIEMQIPSRPATPAHRDGPSVSTPGGQPSNSLPSQPTTASLPTRRASTLATDGRPGPTAQQVDESEWAAFEADIAATSIPYDADAVISAPAMTAEETAAAAEAEEEEARKRREQADVDLEDEKEEATRALEEEFEEMEELEARVRRLKEKREALRKRGESFGQEAAPAKPTNVGKENLETPMEEEEDEDEDDEEDDDDWDGFRFRTN
ncbi:hypothetical protein BGZ61DRAFT_365111 [Ilyonectria robusta]|uniref:uncharacterized protein n=1 Tax=Ilyonectria robusta TaxID=1079257 RepID=UPI001E8D174D|nr:uncharacterized protein BGZ61DRAFT_365111 [Ilyonectria robusta]KAH8667294.1 hypothetical protein BGZ61DRAFT_365111 [Ilyonectria robusta]